MYGTDKEIQGIKDALDLLLEKKNYFEQELRKTADADTKFSLQIKIKDLEKEIETMRGKLEKLECKSCSQNSANTSQNPKSQAKQFLIDGNLKKALETILEYAQNQGNIDLENDSIFQLGHLNGVEKQQTKGIISHADYGLAIAKIRAAAQALLGEME